MTRSKALLISISALVLTVPWWFTESNRTILGLPEWAFYAVFTATIYSIIIAYVLGKYWQTRD
ncbi:MAG: hypothetical protein QF847_02000 [Candidatus Marinimicrobia bacterium]|mgnify:FL=1|jgi:ABC-type sugar transport system permease subunit|nr:hypothetical protein [Candidatus Neomarinimicrobiota bacterium]